jgi:hypothetical protein
VEASNEVQMRKRVNPDTIVFSQSNNYQFTLPIIFINRIYIHMIYIKINGHMPHLYFQSNRDINSGYTHTIDKFYEYDYHI